MNATAIRNAGSNGQGLVDRHDDATDGSAPIAFGAWVAWPRTRVLSYEGEPVNLGGRAFDLLMALLRSPGEIVPKEVIMREVWPTTIVDESNLRFQMSCLRKVIGKERDRIKTISGRGYLFIGDDRSDGPATPEPGAGPREASEPMMVIIDGEPADRAILLRVLVSAGIRLESVSPVDRVPLREPEQGREDAADAHCGATPARRPDPNCIAWQRDRAVRQQDECLSARTAG